MLVSPEQSSCNSDPSLALGISKNTSSSATLPAPDAPATQYAMPWSAPCPKPASDQTPLRRPLSCRQYESLVFQEQCARSGPPVRPILPLFVGCPKPFSGR